MNTNPNLPANAVSTSKVVPGMRFYLPSDPNQKVYTATSYARSTRNHIFFETDHGLFRLGVGGTVRLAD